MSEHLEVDHIIIGVGNLDRACDHLRDLGLGVQAGGEHPGWGTANAIVPLGDTYLEIVTVVDPRRAADTGFGAAVIEMIAGTRAWGWAVRSSNLVDTATRWRCPVSEGSRTRPDGSVLRWQLTGVEVIDANRPFALQWGDGVVMPGESAPAGDHLDEVAVSADADVLTDWLAGEVARIRLIDEPPTGVHRLTFTAGGHQHTLEWPLPFNG